MRLVKLLLVLFSAMIAGVSFIAPPDKAFTEQSYFQEEQEAIDYKKLYDESRSLSQSDENKCDRTARSVKSGKTIYLYDELRGYYPSVVNSDFNGTVPELGVVEINGAKYEKLVLSEGDEIVLPRSGTVVNSSVGNRSLYPQSNYSLGTTVKFNTDDGYVITFASLERLWCCMDKAEPSGTVDNDDQPYYLHSDPFTGVVRLRAGDVVGVAGHTGVPETIDEKAICLIRIEKNGDEVKLKDFFTEEVSFWS